MKGVASLTRRFFNNSIQTHTFFETDVGACQTNGGRVVPVYWRSNWRLLEAEVGIEPRKLYRFEPNTLCFKAFCSLIFPGVQAVFSTPRRPLAIASLLSFQFSFGEASGEELGETFSIILCNLEQSWSLAAGGPRYFLAFASRADCNALVSLCPSAPVSAAIIIPVSPSTSTGQGMPWTPYCTATAAFEYWPS